MSEIVERPREVIARVHAERDIRWKELGSGEIADTIIAELAASGFVIVPRDPAPTMIDAGHYAETHGDGCSEIPEVWRLMIDAALK